MKPKLPKSDRLGWLPGASASFGRLLRRFKKNDKIRQRLRRVVKEIVQNPGRGRKVGRFLYYRFAVSGLDLRLLYLHRTLQVRNREDSLVVIVKVIVRSEQKPLLDKERKRLEDETESLLSKMVDRLAGREGDKKSGQLFPDDPANEK